MLEETGGMTSEQRIKHLQENVVGDIAGMLSGPDAQKRAAVLASELIGSTPEARTAFFTPITADVNTFSVSTTGRHLAGNAQIYDKAVIEKSARDAVLIENRARRMADMSRGNESSIVQRMSEGVAEIGRGGKFDLESFTQRTAGILKVAGMKDKFAPDFADALGAGTEALGKAEAAGNEEEAQRLSSVIHAIHNGNEKELITVAARGFADKRIQEQKLEGKAAAEVRAQYEKAALGDTAALEAVKAQMDTDTFKLFKGLYTATTVHDKEGGLTLSGSGFAPLVNEAAQHFDNAEKADREAQARALIEAGKQRVDAERAKQNTDAKSADDAKQKPGILGNALDFIWGSVFGGEVDKGAKPEPKQSATPAGTETANMSASTVQLAADTVTVSARASDSSTAGVTLRPEDFPRAASGLGRPAVNSLAQASPAGGGEMVLNGTVTLKNLQEGIASFVGEPPLSTGDGPSIMHPHTLPA
jgi:hypothetical protein